MHTGLGVQSHIPQHSLPAHLMRMSFLSCISFPGEERSKPNTICWVILWGAGSWSPLAGLELCSRHQSPFSVSILLVPH